MKDFDLLVLGGGAAGFFTAINVHEKNPSLRVAIIEKHSKVLQKVKISGGGRCNVTNAISDPILLSANYPRGGEFLISAFEKFNTRHTIDWFKNKGVRLKIEEDGRVFPSSNSSQTIVDCFLHASRKIPIITGNGVKDIKRVKGNWQILLTDGSWLLSKYLVVATGSDSKIWQALETLGIKILPEVPSLFTFKINNKQLTDLQGVSLLECKISSGLFSQEGPILITHWGLSGPAALKLSAWGALEFNEKNYNFQVKVNWMNTLSKEEIQSFLTQMFAQNPKKNIRNMSVPWFSQRFWEYLCIEAGIAEFQKGAEAGKKQIRGLIDLITSSEYQVIGKSTFKEEFVTAGGVDLNEIEALTFKSRKYSTLFFAGEVLNIDALTGGFNFQAAWTSGWLISEEMRKIYQ